MHETIVDVLRKHAQLSADPAALEPDQSLYEAGMTSHATVNVMLALEGAFDVEFPDDMLSRSVFESIASISAAIEQLTQPAERLAG